MSFRISIPSGGNPKKALHTERRKKPHEDEVSDLVSSDDFISDQNPKGKSDDSSDGLISAKKSPFTDKNGYFDMIAYTSAKKSPFTDKNGYFDMIAYTSAKKSPFTDKSAFTSAKKSPFTDKNGYFNMSEYTSAKKSTTKRFHDRNDAFTGQKSSYQKAKYHANSSESDDFFSDQKAKYHANLSESDDFFSGQKSTRAKGGYVNRKAKVPYEEDKNDFQDYILQNSNKIASLYPQEGKAFSMQKMQENLKDRSKVLENEKMLKGEKLDREIREVKLRLMYLQTLLGLDTTIPEVNNFLSKNVEDFKIHKVLHLLIPPTFEGQKKMWSYFHQIKDKQRKVDYNWMLEFIKEDLKGALQNIPFSTFWPFFPNEACVQLFYSSLLKSYFRRKHPKKKDFAILPNHIITSTGDNSNLKIIPDLILCFSPNALFTSETPPLIIIEIKKNLGNNPEKAQSQTLEYMKWQKKFLTPSRKMASIALDLDGALIYCNNMDSFKQITYQPIHLSWGFKQILGVADFSSMPSYGQLEQFFWLISFIDTIINA